MFEDDNEPVVWVQIPLTRQAAARLQALSEMCGDDPPEIAASLLHDLLEEDAICHGELVRPPGTRLN